MARARAPGKLLKVVFLTPKEWPQNRSIRMVPMPDGRSGVGGAEPPAFSVQQFSACEAPQTKHRMYSSMLESLKICFAFLQTKKQPTN